MAKVEEGQIISEEQHNDESIFRQTVEKIEEVSMGGIDRELILIKAEIFKDGERTNFWYLWREVNSERSNTCLQTTNEFWCGVNKEAIQEHIDALVRMKSEMEE